MDAKIDYVSFTVMFDARGEGDSRAMFRAILAVLYDKHPHYVAFAESLTGWEEGGARGHYAFSQFQPTLFMAIRYGGQANHVLLEIPGTACQAARDAQLLDDIIRDAAERLTRLDLAIDIPDGCSPSEFVGAGYNKRFEAHATLHSAEGNTEYVGSMKSERYARVYMYNPPHPRAFTLRVEHVLRSGYAKSAASIVETSGVLGLATACGNSFGWLHQRWKPEYLSDGKLHSTRADRHEPGRLRWLYQVVLPAIAKAHEEGLIDAWVFCDQAQRMINKNL